MLQATKSGRHIALLSTNMGCHWATLYVTQYSDRIRVRLRTAMSPMAYNERPYLLKAVQRYCFFLIYANFSAIFQRFDTIFLTIVLFFLAPLWYCGSAMRPSKYSASRVSIAVTCAFCSPYLRVRMSRDCCFSVGVMIQMLALFSFYSLAQYMQSNTFARHSHKSCE